MAEAWFDPWEDVRLQAIDPDNAAATDDELEEALAPLFVRLTGDAKEVRIHDRRGWFADFAGSEKCLALGHKPQSDDYPEWDEDTHSVGWDGGWLCDATRHGVACTYCESDDCEAKRLDVNVWAAPGVGAAPATSPRPGDNERASVNLWGLPWVTGEEGQA